MKKPPVWFWQRIVSPHVAALAAALADLGFPVVYVAEQEMSHHRAEQGWLLPSQQSVKIKLATSAGSIFELVRSAPLESIHICQGLRANGLVGVAQRALARKELRQWVVMETVDDSGFRGFLKRVEYRRLFFLRRNELEGVLAIGHETSAWVEARGMRLDRIYPFAYFLPKGGGGLGSAPSRSEAPFKVLFVGQFIALKRLDLLISALAKLANLPIQLRVVGSGPHENQLKEAAFDRLPGRVDWIGRLPMDQVQRLMGECDCLVLPSRHDGWGAVISEALMVGTQVICSHTCGAAGVVASSGYGGVFSSGDEDELKAIISQVYARGTLTNTARLNLAQWAECLGAEVGAHYLSQILQNTVGLKGHPSPPWALGKVGEEPIRSVRYGVF